ncbi:7-deoxyloganetin glucosyltransferase-like [Triticum urartu]|uniref:7-deoxyloganetin glucosyltransferase-like n=1 Tax=Triticum urartu TaxID=4572 RepID=UPI002043B872|nr:7-deoxyloganetin glucosyltransferase-like [Triticum urartu]
MSRNLMHNQPNQAQKGRHFGAGTKPAENQWKELNDAASTGDHPVVTCIVSDLTMCFAMDAAKELDVPYVQLWTASTVSYLGFRYFRLLIDRGIVPLQDTVSVKVFQPSPCILLPIYGFAYIWTADEKQLTDGYLDTPLEDLPGLRNMRLRDFLSFIMNPDDYMVVYAIQVTESAAGASAVIVNSFDDFEGEAVGAMEALLGGPKEECLQWLHGKEPASFVYVNFGSITVMTKEQLLEFTWGLANSGRQFMWIIRHDLARGDAAVLPPEFMAEKAGRGFMASWCPQQEVLNHPAIGVFLTHSGWNSTMDSMCGGVPVISWPFFSDQLTNCRYQCNEWGVGMEIDRNVQRNAATGLITELMQGESGKKMRKRAEEWREKAILAARPGGSSHRNFKELLCDVLLRFCLRNSSDLSMYSFLKDFLGRL